MQIRNLLLFMSLNPSGSICRAAFLTSSQRHIMPFETKIWCIRAYLILLEVPESFAFTASNSSLWEHLVPAKGIFFLPFLLSSLFNVED